MGVARDVFQPPLLRASRVVASRKHTKLLKERLRWRSRCLFFVRCRDVAHEWHARRLAQITLPRLLPGLLPTWLVRNARLICG